MPPALFPGGIRGKDIANGSGVTGPPGAISPPDVESGGPWLSGFETGFPVPVVPAYARKFSSASRRLAVSSSRPFASAESASTSAD